MKKKIALISSTLALLLGLAALAVYAQGQYGVFASSTYTGNENLGPMYVPTGFTWPATSQGAQAMCLAPSYASGLYMGIYLGPTYSGCPNGSNMYEQVVWPGADGSSYTLQGMWQDFVPDNGAQQAYWIWYNWCSRINNGPLLASHCSFYCDGSSITCQR